MLRRYERLPEGLLQADATELADLLGGPTLIHLPGRQPQPLFVSVLMHGNETTGFDAMKRLLRRYGSGGSRELPRALSLFIGNVSAAREGQRRLSGQPDYNRVWPGAEGDAADCPEGHMMAEVVEEMERRQVFASIDIHNNTGLNPHYACVNRIDHRYFHLAVLFSPTVVYFIRPSGVQSVAFANLCPAVTLECGQSGQAHGAEHALEYVEACLHLCEHPEHPVAEQDMHLFHTVATVKIPDGLPFGFDGESDRGLMLDPDLERMNFTEVAPGTPLARVGEGCAQCLDVTDELGNDVAGRFFGVNDGELLFRMPVMPSMLTLDEEVIRQDCLCYLMERYPLQAEHG